MTGYDPYLPTITFGNNASINVTAEQLAEGFWSLDSAGMADFFTELERIASWRLCFQMAAVIEEIAKRADAPNYDYRAMHGFQTMLSHAKDFHDSAAEIRAGDAKRYLAEMARIAKNPAPIARTTGVSE